MKRHSVLVIQRILPPYRLPFFQRLGASPALDIHVAYGTATSESGLKSVENPQGVLTERLRNLYFGKGEVVVVQRGLLGLLLGGKYDAVIAEFNLRILSNLMACVVSNLLRKKFIWWGQGVSPTSGRLSLRLRMLLTRLSDAVIFYEEPQAMRFVSMGLPKEKTFVAANSIDTEEIAQFAEDRPLAGRHRILYIGRLIEGKKVDLLLRAFARARVSLPPGTELTVIGSGPESEKLSELAQELGLAEQVGFVPAVYEQAQLASYFNSAWVSVSPGRIGLSAIHSLAYGVPMIVARDEPHRPEVIALEEGINTLFFNSNDADDLAQRLLELSSCPERHARMSRAALDKIHNHFSLKAMVKTFEEAVTYARNRVRV